MESGLVFRMVPMRVFEQECRRLEKLFNCRLVRPVGIIHRRHHKLSSTAQGFIKLLQQANGTTADAAGANGTHDRGRGSRGHNGAARASH